VRDPRADVDGHDSVAKVMILGALVFGRQLRAGDAGREALAQLLRRWRRRFAAQFLGAPA
jgi:homoserine dehydrogenase